MIEGEVCNFEFVYEDPIFNLQEPNNEPMSFGQTNSCNCCSETYKANKDIKYCQFCAQTFCNKCLFVKKKIFPSDPEENRGDICKVCDRKFYVRDILFKSKQQIEDKGRLINGDEVVCDPGLLG